MAYRTGASVDDMAYIQFHPTAPPHLPLALSSSPKPSEAWARYCSTTTVLLRGRHLVQPQRRERRDALAWAVFLHA